jgi:hypothetical protein
VFPAVLKVSAIIVEAYVKKAAAPAQPVRKIKGWRTPFIQFLSAMRTNRPIFHNLCHSLSPLPKKKSRLQPQRRFSLSILLVEGETLQTTHFSNYNKSAERSA